MFPFSSIHDESRDRLILPPPPLRLHIPQLWSCIRIKRHDDPDAHENGFQEEERERSGFAPTRAARGYDEVERIARKLKEEVDRIRAMYAKKRGGFETPESGGVDGKKKEDRSGAGAFVQLDKERALKVSLVKVIQLREVFEKFGGVEDVVIRSTKKKRSALIVMATKDEAVEATRTLCGDLSNPLLVRGQTDFVIAKKSGEPQSNIVGVGYQAYEDQVMERLRKVFLLKFMLSSVYCLNFRVFIETCSAKTLIYYFFMLNRRREREMEGFVDHYILSSGEEALKLSEKEMSKAFKLKALNLHKRQDDPKWIWSWLYSGKAQREVFEKFDVVIRSTIEKCSALIVMATKDEAVAVTRTLCGDLSNPLLVVPLQRAQTDFVTAKKSAEAEPQRNIVGDGSVMA
ncbi:LOW QUALITY PROTEIN: hypothetical protein HID58_049706 [Brassica napus]|uniref:RRM domain-containing protein n=1 Tax=Brassica napus TaxID=3708 RepID=A0ABQ8B5Z1_BRANA|nr:LOW QUALITY PROTEIN: hypothetical protein HID58_049706 [Brassica napus]